MRKITTIVLAVAFAFSAYAQKNTSVGKLKIHEKGKGYYYESILKDVSEVDEKLEEKAPYARFEMDQSGLDLPNDKSLYTTVWCQPTESQGNGGTCWSFSTSSFYESEIYRIHGKKVELSEIYIAYWEYVEKARRFIEKRGNSLFAEGSEGNAVARIMNMYGIVPVAEYSGKLHGRKFHTHAAMMKEMSAFLNSLKVSNAWNVEAGLETIKAIMDHHIGAPPTEFVVEGKKYTPKTYLKEYLQIDPNDFVEILSYKQEPYWQQVEYKVPDNWWHNADYYNIPLNNFMAALKKSSKGWLFMQHWW